MTAVVIRASGVARTFGHGPNAVVAVYGASCELSAGDQVALIGPSGSGKTTLIHLLAGLDLPTTGTVEWPAIGSRAQLRCGPGVVVFQGCSLLATLDVVENVALALLLQGMPPSAARRSATEALERLRLAPLASKLPGQLSVGQAQRVAVARALAGRPQLILADEPTGPLDRVEGAAVVGALIDFATEFGAALVVSTHDTNVAERFDSRWSINGGRLIQRIAARC